MPNPHLSVNNYTDYDRFKEAVDSFSYFTKLKMGENGLESDTRVRHYMSIRSWKAHNQAIEQSTKNLAEKLQNALIDKFGKQYGSILFNRYISKDNIEGKKRITALDLKFLFAKAKQLENDISNIILKASSNAEYDKKTVRVLKSCNIAPQMVRHILSRVAISLEDHSHNYQDLLVKNDELKKSTREMVNLKTRIEKSDVPDELKNKKDELLGILGERIGNLQDKQSEIEREITNYPFKKGNVTAAADEMITAGRTVLRSLAKEYKTDMVVRAKLKTCAQYLQKVKNDLNAKYANLDVVDPEDAKILKTFGKDFAKQLAQATGKDEKELNKAFKKAHIAVLEQKEWKTISNDFTVSLGGQQVKVNSEITPAAKLPFLKAEMKADNLNGITCHDQGRSSHAVNLWKTEFTSGGKTLYSGIRHSVNCAFDISDRQTRAEANANRAKDIFKAALARNPKLLNDALNGKTVKLDIVSVALMTPDLARKILPFGFKNKEREHLEEQTNAWKDACDERGICRMQVTDDEGKVHDISVQPNVVAFNYGVNQGAQVKGLQTILSSWDKSDEMNKQALNTLIGDPSANGIGGMVGQFLETCHDDVLRGKITTLVDQIKKLHNTQGYRVAGEDSFRMPARINLLAYLCGFTPCFNCKSGKDRTGQLDVSTKELALTLEMKNRLSMKTDKDSQRTKLMADIALHSGNLEVQEYNTGMAGFRLKGLECLEKIYGKNNMTHFVGLSEYC